MARRNWNKSRPIQRLSIQRGGFGSFWRQPGRNCNNLHVIEAKVVPDLQESHEKSVSNSNSVQEPDTETTKANEVCCIDDAIAKHEKDFDEISDSPLVDDENFVEIEENWENVSDSSFELCEEAIDSSDETSAPKSNEFSVGYRPYEITYLKNFKHVGLYRPRMFVISKTRVIVNCMNLCEKTSGNDDIVAEVDDLHISVSADSKESGENIPVVDENKISKGGEVDEQPSNSTDVGTLPDEEIGFCQRKLVIQEDIDNSDKLIIGTEYIVEVWNRSTASLKNYLCWLCDRKLLEKSEVLDHLSCLTHKDAYLAKHYPSQKNKFLQSSPMGEGSEVELDSFCKEIVEGGEKPLSFVTTEEYLNNHSDGLECAISAAFHYEEKKLEDLVIGQSVSATDINQETSEQVVSVPEYSVQVEEGIIEEKETDCKPPDSNAQAKQINLTQKYFSKAKLLYNPLTKYKLSFSLQGKVNKTLYRMSQKKSLGTATGVEKVLSSNIAVLEKKSSYVDDKFQNLPAVEGEQQKKESFLPDSVSMSEKKLSNHDSAKQHAEKSSKYASTQNKSKDNDYVNLSNKIVVSKKEEKTKLCIGKSLPDRTSKQLVERSIDSSEELKRREMVKDSVYNKQKSKTYTTVTNLRSQKSDKYLAYKKGLTKDHSDSKSIENSLNKSKKGPLKNENLLRDKYATTSHGSNYKTAKNDSPHRSTSGRTESEKLNIEQSEKRSDSKLDKHSDEYITSNKHVHDKRLRQRSPISLKLRERQIRHSRSPSRRLRQRSRSPQQFTRYQRSPQHLTKYNSRSPQRLSRYFSRSPENLYRERSRSPLFTSRNYSPLRLSSIHSRSSRHLIRNRSRSPQYHKSTSEFSKARRSRSDSRSRKFRLSKFRQHSRSLSRSPRRHRSRPRRRQSRSVSRSPNRRARTGVRSNRRSSNSNSRSRSSSPRKKYRGSKYSRHSRTYSSDSEREHSGSPNFRTKRDSFSKSNSRHRSDSASTQHSRIPSDPDVWAVVRSMNELTNESLKMNLAGRENLANLHKNIAEMRNLGISNEFVHMYPSNFHAPPTFHAAVPNAGNNSAHNFLHADGSLPVNYPMMNTGASQFPLTYAQVLPQPQHAGPSAVMPDVYNNQMAYGEFLNAPVSTTATESAYGTMPPGIPMQSSGFGNEKVFQDLRNVVSKLFGTQSAGTNILSNHREGLSSVQEMKGSATSSAHVSATNLESVSPSRNADSKSFSRGSNRAGKSLLNQGDSPTKTHLKKTVEQTHSSKSSSSHENKDPAPTRLALPPDAKVQFKESSKVQSSVNIFPIVKHSVGDRDVSGSGRSNESAVKVNVSPPSENNTKVSLAQRLASVLVKLNMVDVPGYLLSEMLRTIGAFDPTMPLQDITEMHILTILQKCGYLNKRK